MWVELGQSPSHFWGLTLREISAIVDGAAERERRAQNDRAWLAWHIAALPKLKRLPKLEKLMVRRRAVPRRRRQSMEEQIEIAQRWHAAVKE